MYRKCTVCSGSGNLWGTPPNIVQGGLLNSPDKAPLSDTENSSYGTSVTCWRCVGTGIVRDDRIDEGG